jgi:hypothetical protein
VTGRIETKRVLLVGDHVTFHQAFAWVLDRSRTSWWSPRPGRLLRAAWRPAVRTPRSSTSACPTGTEQDLSASCAKQTARLGAGVDPDLPSRTAGPS